MTRLIRRKRLSRYSFLSKIAQSEGTIDELLHGHPKKKDNLRMKLSHRAESERNSATGV